MNVSQSSSALAAGNGTVGGALKQGTAQLGREEFLKLLVTQLKNQDPLNPMSQSDFTTQLAQLSQLDSLQQLNSNLSSLMLLQGLGQGANLIGKTIGYVTANSSQVLTGTVSAVSIDNSQVQLQIGDAKIGLDAVRSIQS